MRKKSSDPMFIKIEEITYVIHIRGQGYPLVCLHGFAEDSSTWEGLTCEGYQLILIDLIGHGLSERPAGKKPYSLRCVLRHLYKIMESIEIKECALLGYSMGGRIALAYALEHGRRISALILESASYGEKGIMGRYRRRREDRKLAGQIVEKGVEWFNDYWSGLSLFRAQAALPEEKKEGVRKRRLGNSAHALANTLIMTGQGRFPCLKGKVGKLDMPVLYLCGALDSKYSAMGREFAALNKRVTLVCMDDVGHNTHLENGEGFERCLKRFLCRR